MITAAEKRLSKAVRVATFKFKWYATGCREEMTVGRISSVASAKAELQSVNKEFNKVAISYFNLKDKFSEEELDRCGEKLC